MALIRKARTAQWPLCAEFVFNFNDTMVDINGVTKTFGFNYLDAGSFDVIPLPLGAVVVGGEVIIEAQGVGPTAYTMNVGTSAAAAAYASAVDLKGAANTRTALLLTAALGSNDGKDVRIAITSSVANASAGKVRVRIMYTLDNRANENTIT
jgi:hypothetical protein